MYGLIRRVFRIYEGEGTKVLHFSLLAVLLQMGLAIGISSADSLFLVRVGAEKLPTIYLITPLMMLAYIPISAYLMGRYGVERLFNITLYVLAGGGVLLYFLIPPEGSTTGTPWVFYVVKLYSGLWFIALYTMTWNFIDRYFDILDAKRLFPLFGGGIALGSILGGSLVTGLVRFLQVEQLYLVWALIALGTLPVIALIRRRWKRIGEEEADVDEKQATLGEQVVVIGSVLRRSLYTNLLILVFLMTLILTTFCEYQYMTVFERGRTAEQVAGLFGRLYMIVNVFNLAIGLILFNRLVAWLGVRNVALIQPVFYTLTFSYFLLDYGFGSAVVGFFAYQGMLTSIEYNNQNFLFNALPSREKATLRTFIEGLCEPVSTAVAGLILAVAASRVSPQTLSLAGLGGALVCLSLVLALRPQYLLAMIGNLRESWLDFSGKGAERVTGLGPQDLWVLNEAVQSARPEQALPAIRILWLNDRLGATQALLGYLERSGPEDQRAAKPLVATMLEAADNQVFRRILIWLERAKAKLDPLLLEEFGRHNLLSREDVTFLMDTGLADNRLAAAAALWDTWRLDGNRDGIDTTLRLLNGSPEEQAAGIRLIGESGRPRYAHFLAPYLAHASAAIRKQALTAVKRLVNEGSYRLLTPILDAIREGDREARQAGLDALSKIRDVECVEPLIRTSEFFTPSERRRTEIIVLEIGLQSVPALIALLRDPQCPYPGRSIATRALGKLAFPQLQTLAPELIDSEIRRAYGFLYNHWALSQERSESLALRFLSAFYRDTQTAVIDFVLELLAISGRLPDYEMLIASLRSRNVKERGNAIESLEQGCSRRVFNVLLPLVDSRSLADRVDFCTRTFGIERTAVSRILMQAVDSRVQFECAGGIQAVWDLTHGQGGGGPECASIGEIMQKKLTDSTMNIVKEVIFSLLDRDLEPEGAAKERLNVLEKAYWIASADFFEAFAISELGAIARETEQRDVADGDVVCREGEAATTACVVIRGEVEVGKGDRARRVGAGRVVGDEALVGRAAYRADGVSRGAMLLAIPKAIIVETARTREQFAISLFAKKLGIETYRRAG